jgi:hypothetical protein
MALSVRILIARQGKIIEEMSIDAAPNRKSCTLPCTKLGRGSMIRFASVRRNEPSSLFESQIPC